MPPEAGKSKPHAALLERFADVLAFYVVSRTDNDELRFVCARCCCAFSYPANGRSERHPAELAVHLIVHGVGPAMVNSKKRRNPRQRHRVDAAGRPEQSRFAFDYVDE